MRSNFKSLAGLATTSQIGDRVLDFLAFVETRSADDAIGKPERDEAIFNGAHLGGGAHENGHVVQAFPVALKIFDVVADGASFRLVVPEIGDGDFRRRRRRR